MYVFQDDYQITVEHITRRYDTSFVECFHFSKYNNHVTGEHVLYKSEHPNGRTKYAVSCMGKIIFSFVFVVM